MQLNKTDIEFINQEFMTILEYHLCNAFKNANDNTINVLCCDGISHIGRINNNVFETTAWIGKNGQDKYEMSIEFSYKFLKDKNHKLPEVENQDWYQINIDKRLISLNL